jgi:hypothetical protein
MSQSDHAKPADTFSALRASHFERSYHHYASTNAGFGSRASPSTIDVGLSISAMPGLRPRMRGGAICREGPVPDSCIAATHSVKSAVGEAIQRKTWSLSHPKPWLRSSYLEERAT